MRRLVRVEDEGAFVARLGPDAAPGADREAQRGATALVAGVTRMQRRLDFLLGHFYHGIVGDLDPPVRQALRVGLFELTEGGVAPHAAVDEAVGLTRQLAGRGAAGLVNAVLRAALRAPSLPEPASGDLADDLAVAFSYPTWMVRRWLARWGEAETRAFLAAGNAAPRFGLRVRGGAGDAEGLRAGLSALGVDAKLSAYLDDFVVVDRLQPVLRGGLVAQGRCAVQDEAAGLVVRVLDPQPGERILDGAAAPGGKAVYAAQRMGGEGTVVALDVSEAKVGLVREAARRLGTSGVETIVGDLREAAFSEPFDRVLLDAPCSGTGVLAKRADLRWRRSPENLTELAGLQDTLLDAAARHVRPAGVLVYSTCSVEPEENESRVHAFLARHPTFALEPVGERVPAAMQTSEGFYAALPHRDGTDGAFAARLRRAVHD